MRKIKTMADTERIQRRNSRIMAVVVIGLLALASVGYSLMSADGESENVVSELGYDFVREGGMWMVAISGSTYGHNSGEPEVFGFEYLPSEVEDIEVNFSMELEEYSGEPLYFVNPNEGASQVLNNVGRYILRYQEACVDSGDGCDGDLPVKDCSSNLIIFEDGNETRVYGDENCVYVVGDGVRASDAFLYEVLNIR